MTTVEPKIRAPQPPREDRSRPRHAKRTIRTRLAQLRTYARYAPIVAAVVLAPLAWSFGHALTRPGTDPLGIRATEWVKDHGGNGIVLWTERTWYSHHAPKKGGAPPLAAIPKVDTSSTAPPVTVKPFDVPAAPTVLVQPAIEGEGVWQPGPRSAGGAPLVYTTFLRPNSEYSSLVTGLAWLDPKRVRFDLYSGSELPGGSDFQLTAPIPTALRPTLVAAFNSGFKLSDSRGGYFAEGHLATGHPLVDGRASLVIKNDGSVDIGQWGRDAKMGPDIRAVRQNLSLLIDGGQEAADLNVDSTTRWGATLGNKTYVWRSGVAVDDQGHLIYAGGMLTVQALADVLKAAGAVRAMELDINTTWVHFFTFHDDPSAPGATGGGKLIPQMSAGTEEYFNSSSRDFIAAFTR